MMSFANLRKKYEHEKVEEIKSLFLQNGSMWIVETINEVEFGSSAGTFFLCFIFASRSIPSF